MSIAFVQEAKSRSSTGGTARSVVFTSNIGVGSGIICFAGWFTSTSTLSSVADANSTAYTILDTFTDAGHGGGATFYLPNSLGGVNPKTINLTFSADPGFCSVMAHEVSGASTSTFIDGSAHVISLSNVAAGTNNITSTNVTPVTNGDYIFGAAFNEQGVGGTWTAGSSPNAFTGEGTSNQEEFDEWFIQTTAASIAANFSCTVAVRGGVTTVAILAASGALVFEDDSFTGNSVMPQDPIISVW